MPSSESLYAGDGVHMAAKQVFANFKVHSSDKKIATDLVLLESLREAHPDFHVTRVKKDQCDLFGYAKSGFASFESQAEETLYDATRQYKVPHWKLDKEQGTLSDKVFFGMYTYTWSFNKFILYQNTYPTPMGGTVNNFYILSARDGDKITRGHSEKTDSLIRSCGHWTSELHEEIYSFDDGWWDKSKELWKSVQGASWDDVILDPVMKASIIDDVKGFFESQGLYKQLGVPWKRGIILHGLPGNGKTASIKSIINELANREDHIPSLYVKSLANCKRMPQRSIRSIFQMARSMAPCLLIFEDLDSLVTDEVRSYFLNEVDGLESNDGILMIGSTNHLGKLDPAISKRPSRFDRKYCYKLPRESERVLYCQFWRKKVAKTNMVDFPEELCSIIAKYTEGWSFAYLKELFIMILITVARGGHVDKESGLSEEEGEADKKPSHALEEVKDTVNGGDGTTDDNTKSKEQEEASSPIKKRVMAEVEIPESLKDNLLLRIAYRQIKTLLEEMDNSDAEEAKKEKEEKEKREKEKALAASGATAVLGHQMPVHVATVSAVPM